jgi:hypothetical protein
MTEEMHLEFYKKLSELVREYEVDIEATDDGKPYGAALPLVAFDFCDGTRDEVQNFEFSDLYCKPPPH